MQASTTLYSRFSAVQSNEFIQSVTGFVLIFACAQISIPLNPVPITLQTVAIMLIGLTFSTRPALGAVTLYLFSGALGAPVFAGWSTGVITFAGPSAGYLFGFFPAVLLMTSWRKLGGSESLFGTLVSCALGTSIILAFGLAWLSHFIGINAAIEFGLIPFIVPGLIKAVLLSGSLTFLRSKT